MKRKVSLLFATAMLTMINPALSAAQTSDSTAASASTAFDRRAAQLVDLFAGKIAFSDYFDPTFQAALPEAQFKAVNASLTAQYGQPLSLERATSADGRSGTILLRFEKGVATILLDVATTSDARVAGLRVTGFAMANDDFERITAEMAALAGHSGFLVAELDAATIAPLASAQPDRQFAVGSTFKLYILDELAAQVDAGKRRWSDVVPLTHASFSSVATANWALSTPVTLQTLANWMIAVSDNGATDTLIHLLGRETIEVRMRGAGHSDISRNIPLLTTVEAFALKGNNFSELRDRYLAADDDAQRQLIAQNSDRLTLSNVDGVSFTAGPRYIDSLEWFASPHDMARLMMDIRNRGSSAVRAAMAINNGVGPGAAADWAYLAYKGGSENGVLSMSLLGERKADGKWFVVTASWNNPDANVESARLVGLVTRMLALAAASGVKASVPPPAP